jgi:hypothetical protein
MKTAFKKNEEQIKFSECSYYFVQLSFFLQCKKVKLKIYRIPIPYNLYIYVRLRFRGLEGNVLRGLLTHMRVEMKCLGIS